MKKILICGATGFIGKNITLGFSQIEIDQGIRNKTKKCKIMDLKSKYKKY